MVRQSFTRSEYDHCVEFKSFNGIFIILVLYVDNMLVARKIMVDINRLKAQLARNFLYEGSRRNKMNFGNGSIQR
jgi:hypothetical protein